MPIKQLETIFWRNCVDHLCAIFFSLRFYTPLFKPKWPYFNQILKPYICDIAGYSLNDLFSKVITPLNFDPSNQILLLFYPLILSFIFVIKFGPESIPGVSTVASLLKMYLRELPEPIFSSRLYPAFMEVAGKQVTHSARLRFLQGYQ